MNNYQECDYVFSNNHMEQHIGINFWKEKLLYKSIILSIINYYIKNILHL